jgi:hypothetical protein
MRAGYRWIRRIASTFGVMPRLGVEERAVRDAHVMRMFLARASYREIARHPRVRLSLRGVELAIKRSMGANGPPPGVMGEQAVTVHVMRLSSSPRTPGCMQGVLRSAMPKALDGDLRAAEVCRRVLDQEARIFGLTARANFPDG